jgi:hypothetical protein
MRFFIIASPFWLAACGQPDIVVSAPPPPAEWLTCEQLPAKPNLDPLAVITLPDGRTAYAKPETDARDAEIARYIVEVRGAHFECWNNLAKIKDYYAKQ